MLSVSIIYNVIKFNSIFLSNVKKKNIHDYLVFQAWTQYFFMATWIWTLCYAIDMKLLLNEKSGRPSWYHMAAWICPAILTILGLSILYIPDAK